LETSAIAASSAGKEVAYTIPVVACMDTGNSQPEDGIALFLFAVVVVAAFDILPVIMPAPNRASNPATIVGLAPL